MNYQNSYHDNPLIRNAELTGYESGKEPAYRRCPVCGRIANIFFENNSGETLGCFMCVHTVGAWDSED